VSLLDDKDLQAGEALRIGGRIHGAGFVRRGGDSPAIILDEVEDGELFQHSHLEGLGHFALSDGPIA